MFRQVSIAATTLLFCSGTAVTVLASQVGATASDSHHTLHITSKEAVTVQYRSGGFTTSGKALGRSGKPLGADLSDCTPVASTRANCTGVLGLDGGLLDARFALNLATGAISGTIVGGTGAYRHTTGTIKGSSFKGGSHLTVSYH